MLSHGDMVIVRDTKKIKINENIVNKSVEEQLSHNKGPELSRMTSFTHLPICQPIRPTQENSSGRKRATNNNGGGAICHGIFRKSMRRKSKFL